MKLNRAFAPMTLHIETEEDLNILDTALTLALNSLGKERGVFYKTSPDSDPRYAELMYLHKLLRK